MAWPHSKNLDKGCNCFWKQSGSQWTASIHSFNNIAEGLLCVNEYTGLGTRETAKYIVDKNSSPRENHTLMEYVADKQNK